MKQINRIRFSAEDFGRFVLMFDKGGNNFATIEIPINQGVAAKLAPYIPVAAVIVMLPPGSIGYVDVFIDQKVPAQLVFDFQVVSCINPYTTSASADDIAAANAADVIPGMCSTECPAGSGTWQSSPCPNPISTNPNCGKNGVSCV